jgi:hypothetical protein
MPSVNMVLTDEDCELAEKLTTRHGFNAKAQAVSESLSLTNFLSAEVNEQGAKVVLEYPDGRREKVIKPELGLS